MKYKAILFDLDFSLYDECKYLNEAVISSQLFVDTENIIDEQTDDYERKVTFLSELNFSYVYNRTFEINLSYKNNPSIENGFMIPFPFGLEYSSAFWQARHLSSV